jgi:hypothetical protein
MCLNGIRPNGKLCTGAQYSQLRHWIHSLQGNKSHYCDKLRLYNV